MKCKRCNGEMHIGVALQNTLAGLPDFSGDKTPVTVSRTGEARVTPVYKCYTCGYSVTRGEVA